MSVPWRQAVLEQGLRQEGLNIYSAGNRLIHLDLTDLDAPYPFVLGIPQSDFESCLRDRLGSWAVRWSSGGGAPSSLA